MNAFWKQLRGVIPSQYQVTHAASPRVMGAFDLPLMFMSTHYLTTFVHPGAMAQTTPSWQTSERSKHTKYIIVS